MIECWNRSDWAAYRAFTGPGHIYEECRYGTARRRHGGAPGRLGVTQDRLSGATIQITRVQVEDDVAVAGVIRRSTQTGPLHTADDAESPAYKQIQVWDLITMRWQAGRVVNERHSRGFLSLMAPLLDYEGTVSGLPSSRP